MAGIQTTRVGIIGGSGLYAIEGLKDISEQRLQTPFGPPSDAIISGVLGAADVFFLPRHGRGHVLLPSEVNYRANIFALKKLGVQWCIAVSAVGSLAEDVAPGDIFIADQLIDRTKGRESTFFGRGVVAHVPFADPYCPVLREVLYDAAREIGAHCSYTTHFGGSFVCMEGPAFSTRAESKLYRSFGARIIGMTALPEAKLAREAEISYATLALVTDYDCWKDDEAAVDAAKAMATMRRNSQNAKNILAHAVQALTSRSPSDLAAKALSHAILTDPGHINPETRQELEPIIGKYLGQPPA